MFYLPHICNNKNCDCMDDINLVVDKLHFQFDPFPANFPSMKKGT